jgi:hypothetical protein
MQTSIVDWNGGEWMSQLNHGRGKPDYQSRISRNFGKGEWLANNLK